MSFKRAAPNDLENHDQHSHAGLQGYPCTPKRPRTSYDPLSPSRYHTNSVHHPTQKAPTAYPRLDALEEGPPAAFSGYVSEPTWENGFSFQHTVRFERVLSLTPAYQPVQAASSVPSETPTYHINTSYNMAQPHFSHIPSFSTVPVPPVTPSTSTAHSALLEASFESPAFKLKLRDPDHTVFHLPPRPNDLPAAYAFDSKTGQVSFWCSRCHTWVGTKSRDSSKTRPFTKHVDRNACIAQYAKHLGLQAPLFPGSSFSIDSALGSLPTPVTCDWPIIFACPNTDMIRPFGDDIYVGVPSAGNADDEPDRSLDESIELPDRPEPETCMSSASAGADLSNPDKDLNFDDDSDTGSVLAEADMDDLRGLEPPDSDDPLSSQVEGLDVEQDESTPSLTELTEMIEDEGDDDEDDDDLSTDMNQTGEGSAASSSRKGRNDAHYVELEGRPLHKATVIRVLLNSDCTKKQSKDRLQRVRTYTSTSVDSTNPGVDHRAAALRDAFKAGDCFATLIRSDHDIPLAIIRCTHVYRCAKLVRESVPRADVPQPEARIKLQGQVLSFVELHEGLRITRPLSAGDSDVGGDGDGGDGEVSAGEETWSRDGSVETSEAKCTCPGRACAHRSRLYRASS
jgi:hypothetical protein